MDITPFSWAGTDLTQYKAVFPEDTPFFGNASFSEIQRAGYWPLRGGKTFAGLVYFIDLFPPAGTSIGAFRNTVGLLFNEESNAEEQLLASDSISAENWFVNAEALGIFSVTASSVRVAVHAAIPVWQAYTVKTNTKVFTASAQTKAVTVGGNRIARPQYNLTVTSPRTGSYAYKRYVIICSQKDIAYTDAINWTDGNFNTNALVAGGKMQATCADLRVTLDGAEIYRYLGGGGANTTTTRPFSTIALPPQIVLTLNGALSNVGAINSISVKNTAANKTALRQLANQKNKVIVISLKGAAEEVFTYTGVNVAGLTITGTKRAQRLSTNKAQVDGATIRHVPHDIYCIYGNSAVSAPSTPVAWQPMFDIANSTNSSHVHADYKDPTNPNRKIPFVSNILKNTGGKCEIYTANHYTQSTGAASEMGMVIRSYKVGATPKAPDGQLQWTLTHPAGITSVTVSGEKYRLHADTGWPVMVALRKSNDGKTWTTVANEATPTAAAAWQALTTVTGVLALGGTYSSVGFFMQGTVKAKDDTYAAVEFDSITLALDTNGIPLVSFGAENTVEFHDFQILNNTTNQWLSFTFPGDINNNLFIDTENLLAYVVETAETIVIALDDESRADWLPFDPKQGGGSNTIQVISAGLAGMTLTMTHRSRSEP